MSWCCILSPNTVSVWTQWLRSVSSKCFVIFSYQTLDHRWAVCHLRNLNYDTSVSHLSSDTLSHFYSAVLLLLCILFVLMALQMAPSHLSFSSLNQNLLVELSGSCHLFTNCSQWCVVTCQVSFPVYSHIWLWCFFFLMDLFKEGYHNLNLMLTWMSLIPHRVLRTSLQ